MLKNLEDTKTQFVKQTKINENVEENQKCKEIENKYFETMFDFV